MFVKEGSVSGLHELVLTGLTEKRLKACVGLPSFDNFVVLEVELTERINAWKILMFSLLLHITIL